jgi:hypothetical protein
MIALNPLRHRAFTLVMMAEAIEVGKRETQNNFAIYGRFVAIPLGMEGRRVDARRCTQQDQWTTRALTHT